MKKYWIILLLIFILVGIMFLPGCGKGNSSGLYQKQIKIFEILGGSAYAPANLNLNGLVFADSFKEIDNEYAVFVGNESESIVPTIQAFYYDENGDKINISVLFTKDSFADDCFNMNNLNNLDDGGTSFELVGKSPGGKGKIIASANGLIKEVNVYVYNSYGSLNTGLNVITKESVSYTDVDSTIYGDTSNPPICVRLNKRSYVIPDSICNGFTWKEKLKNIKSVDVSKFVDGSEHQALEGPECPEPKIFIAEASRGGYIKVVKINPTIIWEYTNKIENGIPIFK
jgi:hypothetical protein